METVSMWTALIIMMNVIQMSSNHFLFNFIAKYKQAGFMSMMRHTNIHEAQRPKLRFSRLALVLSNVLQCSSDHLKNKYFLGAINKKLI